MPTWTMTAASNDPSSRGMNSPAVVRNSVRSPADPVTEETGGLDELRSEVDPGHRGARHGGHPRGAPDSATDIEQPNPGRDLEAVENVPARRCASRVQLVDRKQIRGPEMVDVDPRTGKRPQNDRGEILGSS